MSDTNKQAGWGLRRRGFCVGGLILAAGCGSQSGAGPDAGLVDAPGGEVDARLPPDAPVISGNAVYVDTSIGAASCTTYDRATRACGAGAATAYDDLNAASGAVSPGDHVWVRQATLAERFVPQRSGVPGGPITFQAYPGETVTITLPGGPFAPGIELTDREYLVLHGIDVDDAMMWAQVLRSRRNVFKNSRYTRARDFGSRGGFRLVDSDYNRILDNTFGDGNDNLFLENSNHNLIAGNTLRRARHTLLVVACSSYNVIRANVLDNPDQKGGETFDCEGAIESLYDDTLQVRRMNATQRNIWEQNRFVGTAPSGNWWDYNAIQFAGQRGLVRKNQFYDNLGGGLGVAVYPDEALYNNQNRVFHNTLFANHCFGIRTPGDSRSAEYFGNEIKNNIVFGNLDCGASQPADIVNANPAVNVAVGNLTGDPSFVNAGARDLSLAPGSPAIDVGVFLTRTQSAGAGTVLVVQDTGYFYDGYGIFGEVGDVIQLEGQTQTAIIVAVDDASHTLTLDRSLGWSANQGVALAFAGAGPDVGALERR